MDAQIKRGLLDACVLAVLSRGESYGYKITQDTSGVMAISESTLYPILRRLEQQGCLSTRSQEHGGRLRKYYRLTGPGMERLLAFRGEWRDIKHAVDYIMEEGDTP
ncbi:MAG: PadR family transcriptional regulator [Oscillospiraceae bacterium]|nr:PadR family transcriptional regulator [Oscillospiraceae bacterium]